MRKTWVVILVAMVVAAAVGAFAMVAARGSKDSALSGGPGGASHKQLWHCGMHPQVIQDHPGDCPICHMALTPIGNDGAPAGQTAERKVLYWWDPMIGATSISNHPGKSAMGMEMVPVYAEGGGPEVRIDPAVVQNMGVRTATVTRGPLKKTVRTVGMLKLPEPGMHDVSLKIGGWIDKLYADQDGMHVEQGQLLFELYSPDLQVAGQELIAAVKAEKSLASDAAPELRREAHGWSSRPGGSWCCGTWPGRTSTRSPNRISRRGTSHFAARDRAHREQIDRAGLGGSAHDDADARRRSHENVAGRRGLLRSDAIRKTGAASHRHGRWPAGQEMDRDDQLSSIRTSIT